ncbi:Ubiquitin carboxyl-terminal hydrolase 47, partial [Lamellibrachia satsuma]
ALTVHVDKRITLGALKKELEPFVGAPSDRFKIYRVFGDNQEYETIRLNETLAAYGDDSRITIKLGQALKKGEYRVRVYQLKVNEQEPFKLLVESIFAKGMTVLDSKKVILKDMAAQGCKPLPPIERCRLRRCSWKNPTTIFADSKVYEEDIQVGPNWEIFLEVLDSPEKLVKQNQLALYVRRWWSSTYEIGPFSEIILDNNSTDELRNKISEVSGIDADNVEFAKGRGTFPCDVSVLDIQQELEWNPNVSCTNSWPLSVVDDGAVLYYRDKMEELAELTEEKRNIIQQRENTRLRSTGRVKVKYSPRKERALKIYTDDTPTRPPTSSRN